MLASSKIPITRGVTICLVARQRGRHGMKGCPDPDGTHWTLRPRSRKGEIGTVYRKSRREIRLAFARLKVFQ
jgi:hypothetical protein